MSHLVLPVLLGVKTKRELIDILSALKIMKNILSQLDLQKSNVLAGNKSTDPYGQQDLKILFKKNPKSNSYLAEFSFH